MGVLRIFMAVAFMLGFVQHAEANKHAVVIGIDAYRNLPANHQLERAVADARAIAGTFKELGFAVTLGENVGRSEFNRLWARVVSSIRKGDTVAVYFSGHGVEIEGSNYLLPSDVPKIEYGRQTQLARESLSLGELLADLQKRAPQVSLIILDACRDNPFALQGRAGGTPVVPEGLGARGLSSSNHQVGGTFIMYAAGQGQAALDRMPNNDADPNSVYTRKLIPLLRTPGLTLPTLAQTVREQVYTLAQTVGHQQVPAYYDGLIGSYCLSGDCSRRAVEPQATKVALPSKPTDERPSAAPIEQHGPSLAIPGMPTITGGCVRIGAAFVQEITLASGMVFCDGRGAQASVKRIEPGKLVAFDEGGSETVCNAGATCSFRWSGSPRFSLKVPVTSEGLDTTGSVQITPAK